MKSITILKDVSIPGVPGFSVGQQVRVKDEIADMLVDRSFAKMDNKVETATDEQKAKEAQSVTLKKSGKKA